MKKISAEVVEMRSEYRREDLGAGVRGKYFALYRAGVSVVLLEPEVAKAFPTSESVNEALKLVLKLAESVRSSGKVAPRARPKLDRAGASPGL